MKITTLLLRASTLIAAFTATLTSQAAVVKNPLLAPWKGSHGGHPPFDQVRVEYFKPALEEAMNAYRAEIAKIADNPARPDFANTLAAMEKAGGEFRQVSAVFDTWSSSLKTPEFQAVEKEMTPKLASFRDEISHNPKLFKRVEAVYEGHERLTPEQKRLAWFEHTHFVLAGARLSEADKAKVTDLNQRLASLYTQFSQNELADEEGHALVVDQLSDLAGLPPGLIEGAAAAAEEKHQKGKWLFANTRSAIEPFLTYADNRALREKAFKMWTSRGDGGDAHDNNKIVTEILNLRQQRAKLLGFPTFAHWKLADTMAKDPQAAMDLMMKVWKPAVARVKDEVAEMQALVDAGKGGFKIAPWDYRYYAEKVRKAKYDLDLEVVKPYLDVEKVRAAMFWAAGELYGFHFKKLQGIPVFHPAMSVYEVTGSKGKHVGLWYYDPYAREGKNSGAWMTAYREQENLTGPVPTIVSNNSNFIPAKSGEPTLISWEDASTMFHEFGHALHGLSSSATYRTLSGTNTAGDFVEFPSQVNENWLSAPQVLKFLTNRRGEAFPQELITKIDKAKTFNQGFLTTEFLASAIVDMKLHLSTAPDIDPRAFEKATLKELGMPDEIVMRHRIPQFGHLFSGEDYAAGYYGYLWAQVLAHDAYAAFTEAGSPFDRATAKRFFKTILSVGNTVDPGVAFRNFRGRDPQVNELLKARGFPTGE